MPKLDFDRGGYIPFKNTGSKFKTSFPTYHSKLWNSLPKNIQSTNLIDFKEFTKKEMKPERYKHFS